MVKKCKSDLPFDNIKIGYVDAKVIGVEGRDADKRAIFGEFFNKQHELDYDISMNDSEKVSTLIHEILHAIVHVFGIKFRDNEHEEDIVTSLSGGITTVLKDNPKFIEWIQKTFHDGK